MKIAIVLFLIQEAIALIIFQFVRAKFKVAQNNTRLSVLKGVLERIIIYLGFLSDIYTVLIFFSAIKLGTRLDDKTKISNDYFLIGNLTSVLLVMITYLSFKYLTTYIEE